MCEEVLQDAITMVRESTCAYCHYITPNDVGATGGHQYGFHVAKSCYHLFFDKGGVKGENLEKTVEITWQKSFVTQSMAKYYGVGTRNEYRLTRYGRDFEFLKDDYIGSLLIMTRNEDGAYNAYVLSNQSNIEDFIATFQLDITKGNQLIVKSGMGESRDVLLEKIRDFVDQYDTFPDTQQMSAFAREIVLLANNYVSRDVDKKADSILLQWVDAEYQLFNALEEKIYRPIYANPFANCQDLIDFSNMILNRRKSRAGKSLEHHLAFIFDAAKLRFEEQVVTENNKKPDFIFPDGASYHNIMFPAERLTMLGAKTTCKDRWRQVLNEANRIPEKHLFTLQRGVSRNQLQEMCDEHLTLVVPKENKTLFLPEFHDHIMCLSDFISMVRERQL
ncbi:MAG: type II restriction endonuclease [Bacteroidaceae bacterium]|nr:type II restriction endonuclease [Bacteroidaceae bacterium]